ncbi:MAG: DUF6371 domain-containing protein [Bacteroidales bacterium]|nr:DUF6371 domain-containing protein [Bacteroidales bacterium]
MARVRNEERIKGVARIEDVVGEFVGLRQRGVRYFGLCPFHDDEHIGNFIVYPPANRCKCFSCGASHDPVGFLMNYGKGMTYHEALRWIAGYYGIPTGGMDGIRTVRPIRMEKKEKKTEKEAVTFPGWMVKARAGNYDENTLVRWIYTLPWTLVQRACLGFWLNEYRVGTSMAANTRGWTIWWTIDGKGEACSGKMMKYGEDGHRERHGYSIDHIHTVLSKAGRLDMTGKEVKGCLFGLHLVEKYPTAKVCVVESEKTALLMQMYSVSGDERIFVATGGKNRLTKEMLRPLAEKNRDIVLYPDKDGTGEWRQAVGRIGYDGITVSRNVMNSFDPEKDGEHADMADIMIRKLRETADG